jgi:hypothetical protein
LAGRGIGGGARGFSKLSGVLLGKRGLVGEAIMEPGKRPGESGPPPTLGCGLGGPKCEEALLLP